MEERQRETNIRTWLIAVGIAVAALASCGGVVALVAVPMFEDYLRRSKVAEAEATLESTLLAVEHYYDLKRRKPDPRSLPGVGTVVRTAKRVPVGGRTVTVELEELSEAERKTWKQLNWPSSRTEMYFQYTYRAEEIDGGVRATVEARADFVEGGPKHTLRQTVTVRDGELEVGEREEMHPLQ